MQSVAKLSFIFQKKFFFFLKKKDESLYKFLSINEFIFTECDVPRKEPTQPESRSERGRNGDLRVCSLIHAESYIPLNYSAIWRLPPGAPHVCVAVCFPGMWQCSFWFFFFGRANS